MSYGGVIIRQPDGFDQMQMGVQPVTPGLDYLAHVDQLVVKQQIELFEVLTEIETRNKYRVMNNQDQEVFFVAEESGCCMRYCCGPDRGFIFHVLSRTSAGQQEVMSIERPFLCCKGCPWCADGCCMYPIFVKDASGQLMGKVRMTTFCCSPRFGIFDPNDTLLYYITGDFWRCQTPCCTDDVNFPVFKAGENTQIANIAKQWAGCFKECVTDADHLGLTFPMNMSIHHKALLLAGVFLIEMTLYERHQNNNNNN